MTVTRFQTATASADAPLILNGAPLPTEDLTGVEVFAVGKWNGDGYSAKQIDELIANTNVLIAQGLLEPPMKIGHAEDQVFLEREGYPAAGWVTKVYRVGDKVVADVAKVPQKIAALIKAGAYRKVSSEIWREYGEAPDGQKYGHVLKAVAFIGEEIPAVGSLDDIVRLYADRSAKKRVAINASGRRADEVVTMSLSDPTSDEIAASLLDEFEQHMGKIKETTRGRVGAPQMRAILTEAHSKIKALIGGAKKNDREDAAEFAHGNETIGGEPPWSEIDAADLPVKAFADGKDKYPHHAVSGGAMYLHLGGLRAALTAARNDASASSETLLHLQAHAEAVGLTAKNATKGAHMDPKQIAKALGLSEDASETDILAKVTENAEAAKKFADAQREVETFKEKEATAAAESTVAKAIADKKVVPAQKAWAIKFARKDPEGFAEFLKDAPTRFSTEERGHADGGTEGESDARSALNTLAVKMARDSKGEMSYTEALAAVKASNPDLAKQAAAQTN